MSDQSESGAPAAAPAPDDPRLIACTRAWFEAQGINIEETNLTMAGPELQAKIFLAMLDAANNAGVPQEAAQDLGD